jgi:hypothetical protein
MNVSKQAVMMRQAFLLLCVSTVFEVTFLAAQGNGTNTSSVPTRAPIQPVPVPDRPCYTNLTEIELLVKQKNPFALERYILCPNTIYYIGGIEAFKPIKLRSYSVFMCGEDGKSSNNCTISGGAFHVLSSLENFSENIVGVALQGLTFDDGNDAGILLAAPGDVTFIDCIFQVSKISAYRSKRLLFVNLLNVRI